MVQQFSQACEAEQQNFANFVASADHASANNFYKNIPQARRARHFNHIQKFSNEAFFESTGFTKKEATALMAIIGPDLERPTARSNALGVEVITALALRVLRTGDELSSCGAFVGVSRASACRCYKEFCEVVVEKMYHLISLSRSQDEWLHHAKIMWQKFGVPNAVGAVNGTIIKSFNKGDENLFWSRKHKSGLNAQILMDSSRMIRFLGLAPGSWHDVKAYRRTRLAKAINENTWNAFPGACALADSGYQGITEFLVSIPKKYPAFASTFYRRHRRARRFIENGFADLKNSFRILRKGVYCQNREDVNTVIQCCCILYNFRKIQRGENDCGIDYLPLMTLAPRSNRLPTFGSQIVDLHNRLHARSHI